MVQNFDRENINELDKFSEVFQYFPYQNFQFITTNDLSTSHYSRWQYMKCHRNVTAPRHTSSSPSLSIIVTLICITAKIAKRILHFIFLVSSTFMHAFILCNHMVVITKGREHGYIPYILYHHVHSIP